MSNFGFAIPSGATILGIEAKIWHSSYGTVTEKAVRIVKGGSFGSTNHASATPWGDNYSPEISTYGAFDHLWGETWTPSDINNSNFGTAVSLESADQNGEGYIDYMEITVSYTP